MWRNILVGFIIPWFLGLGFIKKDKKLALKTVPFVFVLATVVCLWGDYKKYWVLKPKFKKNQYLTTMPFNLGLYPVLSVLMIELIRNTRRNFVWIIIISLFTTAVEGIGVHIGKVKYYNGWNIVKTFVSYLVPYYLVYRYYLWTNKHVFFSDISNVRQT